MLLDVTYNVEAWSLAAILFLASIFMHWRLWYLARREGRKLLGWVTICLGVLSLCSLIGLGTISPLVAAVLAAVTNSGRMEHVSLGVALEPTKPGPEPAGLAVRRVDGEGLAARAGLVPGDVILGVEGVPVMSVPALRGRLTRAGPQPEISIRRNGKTESLTIKTK